MAFVVRLLLDSVVADFLLIADPQAEAVHQKRYPIIVIAGERSGAIGLTDHRIERGRSILNFPCLISFGRLCP